MKRWTIYDPIAKFLLDSLTIVGVGTGISVLVMFYMLWHRPIDESSVAILDFIVQSATVMLVICGAIFSFLVAIFIATSLRHLWPYRKRLCRRARIALRSLPSVRAIAG